MRKVRVLVALLIGAPSISGCVIGVEMVGSSILGDIVAHNKARAAREEAALRPPPARYQSSENTTRLFKLHAGGKAAISGLAAPATDYSDCREFDPLPIEYQITIPQFVAKAIYDELSSAGLYDGVDGAQWTGQVTKIELSVNPSQSTGWWNLAVKIRSDTGTEVNVESRHVFAIGADARNSCERLAPEALGPATQALLTSLATHPQFPSLLRRP